MSDQDPGFTEERAVRESEPKPLDLEEWTQLEQLCHRALIDVPDEHEIANAIKTTGSFSKAVALNMMENMAEGS